MRARGHAETAKARAVSAQARATEMLRRYKALDGEESALARRQRQSQPSPEHPDVGP